MYKSKPEFTELENPDFHECGEGGCLNTYTPFEAPDGERYCVTHGKKEN